MQDPCEAINFVLEKGAPSEVYNISSGNEISNIETVKNPESLASGYLGRKIAQSKLTPELILRVVCEETDNKTLVITVYPARRRRYK